MGFEFYLIVNVCLTKANRQKYQLCQFSKFEASKYQTPYLSVPKNQRVKLVNIESQPTPYIPASRYAHTATLIGTKLYFLGGIGASPDGTFTNSSSPRADFFTLDLSASFDTGKDRVPWEDLKKTDASVPEVAWGTAAVGGTNKATIYLFGGSMSGDSPIRLFDTTNWPGDSSHTSNSSNAHKKRELTLNRKKRQIEISGIRPTPTPKLFKKRDDSVSPSLTTVTSPWPYDLTITSYACVYTVDNSPVVPGCGPGNGKPQRIYLLGGYDAQKTVVNEKRQVPDDVNANSYTKTYKVAVTTSTSNTSSKKTPTSMIADYTATYVEKYNSIIYIGGKSETGEFIDMSNIWVYNIDKKTFSIVSASSEGFSVSPRIGHSSVLVQKNCQIIVYGGQDKSNQTAAPDLLILDITNETSFRWQQKTATNSPTSPFRHTATFFDRYMIVAFGRLTTSPDQANEKITLLDVESFSWVTSYTQNSSGSSFTNKGLIIGLLVATGALLFIVVVLFLKYRQRGYIFRKRSSPGEYADAVVKNDKGDSEIPRKEDLDGDGATKTPQQPALLTPILHTSSMFGKIVRTPVISKVVPLDVKVAPNAVLLMPPHAVSSRTLRERSREEE
ncbi:5631_t:CDS:2 [Ambispora gerdemannii]|uniref:5631_t:CDS:1 n=1 Tax=Ambispora gerdemannii TaxID=144530 RepID=A0A9N9FA41_9GLOM|nr:5631_t:CDS:2 [Ambispora gerdemannii]